MAPDDTQQANQPAVDTPAPPAQPAAPVPPGAGRPPSPWPGRISQAAGAGHEWLMRPRIRLAVTGVTLLLIGGLLMTNSVWTLPLVIVGALMVVVAWIGHRLEGRFTVEWGETGTELAFRATIKPAQAALEPAPGHPVPGLVAASAAASQPDEIIEGEAHTVEIDVAELKALIAAAEIAETTQPRSAPGDQAGQEFRVRRTANGAGHSTESLRSAEPSR